MMNVIAICLVLTSLVAAGVWSPTPENPNQNPNLIVKDGHRVVVVEYDKEYGNTKVVISPDDSYVHAAGEKISDAAAAAKGAVEDVKDRVKDSASDVKDRVQDSASDVKDKVKDAAAGPRELICDAFGKCKHKIASALGKTKEKVTDTVHGVEENVEGAYEKARDVLTGKPHEGIDRVKEMGEGARDKAHEGIEKVKEMGEGAKAKSHEGIEKVKEMGEGARDKAHEGIEKVKEMGESAKAKTHEGIDMVKEKGEEVKEKVHQGYDKVKEMGDGMKMKDTVKDNAKKIKSFDMVDSPKRIGEDIQHNVSGKAEGIAEEVKAKAGEVKEEAKKGVMEVLSGFIWYMLPLKRLDSVIDVLHLLGVSTAYGMCMFVSYVSSYVLSRVLTKQQFGMVQSRLYPVYHKALTVCVGLGLLGHVLGQRRRVLTNKLEMFQALDLLAALSMVMGNSLFLEPRATKLMFERMKFDKEGKGRGDAPRGGVAGGFGDPVCMSSAIGAVGTSEDPSERPDIIRMTERLKKLNMYSSFLNMLTFIFLSWHLVYLAGRLQLTR